MREFESWCAMKEVSELPADPEDVALFIADNITLGTEKLWPMIREISLAHTSIGLPDPVQAPRSWTKEEKILFFGMPYQLQICVFRREAERDRAVKKAQNEAGILKEKLAAIEKRANQLAKVTNGNQSHAAA